MRLGTLGFLPGPTTGWKDGEPGSKTRRRFTSVKARTTVRPGVGPRACGWFWLSAWHLRHTSYSKRTGSTFRPVRSIPQLPRRAPWAWGAPGAPGTAGTDWWGLWQSTQVAWRLAEGLTSGSRWAEESGPSPAS